MKHFLQDSDFTQAEIGAIFERATAMKRHRAASAPLLEGQSWGMMFYKNSTRTRISFDVGLHELGAHPVMLDVSRSQLSRGESVADTARVMSRYLHGLVIRCHEHELIEAFAQHGSIPVVNALTDFLHPCQAYTDYFSMVEHFAPKADTAEAMLEQLRGLKVAFLGDAGSNMANSLALTGAILGAEVVVCGPEKFAPGKRIQKALTEVGGSGKVRYTADVAEAVQGAQVLYTDVWVSMGDEAEKEQRQREMGPYSVTAGLMAQAASNAIFMHCLPAHPGEEVAAEVLESPASIVFDQAENRLHVQKAILAALQSAS